MLNDAELRHLQQCELFIAKELKRICDKYKIQYFMGGGTLLGAVRHGGFIPWDDDMDFGMRRDEFERFCDICKKELDPQFVLQTMDTEQDYPLPIGKIRIRGTEIQENFAASSKAESHGISIDIFPYDNAPDDEKNCKKQARRLFIYKRMMWIKKGYGKNMLSQSLKQKIKYILSVSAGAFIPYQKLKNRYKKALVRYNTEQTGRLVTDGAYEYRKNFIDSWQLDELKPVKFEDTMFPGLKDNDRYLTHLYGDYKQLPKVEDRHNHEILSVDFGKYSMGIKNKEEDFI